MDRYKKYSESEFETINNMNDILEALEWELLLGILVKMKQIKMEN